MKAIVIAIVSDKTKFMGITKFGNFCNDPNTNDIENEIAEQARNQTTQSAKDGV